MLQKSTLKLLKIPFSFFLSPTYFFALALMPVINWFKAILIFFILHFLVYPASNGYNSYMDRDTESIGGLEKPPLPTTQLFWVVIVLELLALVLSLIVGWLFTLVLALYVAASKAYSYRGIRIKKFPYLGYLTVIIFQGAVTFWLVYHGSSYDELPSVPWSGMLISTLLIGGFYPLTQIYQHRQDVEDGVETISYKLGYIGTFIFCAAVYLLAWLLMARHFISNEQLPQLWVIGWFFLPVAYYFVKWFMRVERNVQQANFVNTMKMSLLAASCTNASFLILLLWRWFV